MFGWWDSLSFWFDNITWACSSQHRQKHSHFALSWSTRYRIFMLVFRFISCIFKNFCKFYQIYVWMWRVVGRLELRAYFICPSVCAFLSASVVCIPYFQITYFHIPNALNIVDQPLQLRNDYVHAAEYISMFEVKCHNPKERQQKCKEADANANPLSHSAHFSPHIFRWNVIFFLFGLVWFAVGLKRIADALIEKKYIFDICG